MHRSPHLRRSRNVVSTPHSNQLFRETKSASATLLCCACVYASTFSEHRLLWVMVAGARRTKKSATIQMPRLPPPSDTFSSLPDRWFLDPFREKIFKLIRPITARTRRKQQRVVAQMPKNLIMKWLEPLQMGDALGLVRESDGSLAATSQSKSLERFKYTIRKGSVSDRLFNFESDNLKSRLGMSEKPRATKEPKHAYKRGLGCTKLQLKRASQRRGNLAQLISGVVGNVLIRVKVPKFLRAMPTIEILFFVATMDSKAHINWPTTFDARTRAQLRTQLRAQLRQMLDDDKYPTSPAMEAAMAGGSDSVRRIPLKRRMVEIPED